jgi:hypothetical protein
MSPAAREASTALAMSAMATAPTGDLTLKTGSPGSLLHDAGVLIAGVTIDGDSTPAIGYTGAI